MSTEDPSHPPNTPEEFQNLIRRVGDKAMQRFAEQFSCERNESEHENSAMTGNACPYCRENLDKGVCKHWVATLADDGDGYDTVTPLYFGWSEHCSEPQEEMIVSLDSYFEGLCALCNKVIKGGSDEARRIIREAKDLPPAEKAILTEAIKRLGHLAASEDYESTEGLLSGELGPQLKNIFTDFFLRCGEKVSKTDWLIDNPPPAPSWSGTHYCAEDAGECMASIIRECRSAIERLRKLIQEP